ncbi:MAG: hypothetical protein MK098_05120 [Marinovum sp.]|nr:hypothetical protein [Marinovum sp.]
MTANLLLLHTTDAHVATFNRLRDRLLPAKRFEHIVRNDWLLRAQREGMTHQLSKEIEVFVKGAHAPVLCTSAALGAPVETAGGQRMDRAMLRTAADLRVGTLLVSAHDAAGKSSLALYEEERQRAQTDVPYVSIVLEKFWPLYTSGDHAGFHAAIAAAVIEVLVARRDLRTVVLSQVAMAPVTHLLDGCGATVLAAPELALHAVFPAQSRSKAKAPERKKTDRPPAYQARESLGEPITT